VQGAFETAFQDRPLDMNEDSFYYARQDLIEQRLLEIKDGMARSILEKHDDKHREKKTLCVGVQWDMCEKQDLLEIVEVRYQLRIYNPLVNSKDSVLGVVRSLSYAASFVKTMAEDQVGYLISSFGTPQILFASLLRSRALVIHRKKTKRRVVTFRYEALEHLFPI
jgi:hypothetical protein